MSKNLRVKTGKAIDETYRISFKFNGSTYYGFKGDTLASALLANDVHFSRRVCSRFQAPYYRVLDSHRNSGSIRVEMS